MAYGHCQRLERLVSWQVDDAGVHTVPNKQAPAAMVDR